MRRHVLALLFLAGCVTNPHTGKRQFIWITQEQELQLGIQAYQEMLARVNISADPREVDPVVRVGRRLADVVAEESYAWEFNVIVDDETVNAWALPGGKIAVYTGIFPILQDEAGLAFVMGHELSHALGRHGAERISRQGLVGGLLNVALGGQAEGAQEAVMAAFGILVSLPFGRSQESEADRLGLEIMARAGYDPRDAVEVWKRMAQANPNQPPEFLSTHPSHDTRIRDLENQMPQALKLYEQARKQPVAKLPRVGGRKGLAKDARPSARAPSGAVVLQAGGVKRKDLEDGRRALLLEFSFNRDAYVEAVRVTGPNGIDLTVEGKTGVPGRAGRVVTLSQKQAGGPDLPGGKYALTARGWSSGRGFTATAEYQVK